MADTSERQLAVPDDAPVRNTNATSQSETDRPKKNEKKRKYTTRLFDLRVLSNETQLQVATAIGVAAPTYGAWERGDRELKAENMMALARHFNVTPNEILDFGEVAVQIPHMDSESERIIKLYRAADPRMRTMAEEVLDYGKKSRRPHRPGPTTPST